LGVVEQALCLGWLTHKAAIEGTRGPTGFQLTRRI
jgi:hypothetical protein